MFFINIVIEQVRKNSPAYYADIQAGEILTAVEGITYYTDIIELQEAFAQEEIELTITDAASHSRIVLVTKEIDEDIGLVFAAAVFDQVRTCHNNCCFCFVDQMPPNMRDTLYVKDDDYRMSFLCGSFITMTNFSEQDLSRITQQHLSPLYISVQATDADTRVKLLRNKYAGNIMAQLTRLKEHNIQFHTQIVLCPTLNDGSILEKSITDLLSLMPSTLSVAIVPVGLTSYRDNLAKLRVFTSAECREVIRLVEQVQQECRMRYSRTVVYLADEFYINAQLPLPPAEYYDGFVQLENGIGLTRDFVDSWQSYQADNDNIADDDTLIICGTSAAKIIEPLIAEFNSAYNTAHKVHGQENEFFGGYVNVSGLLTARDIKKAIAAQPSGRRIAIPAVTLRRGEEVFLDDVTLVELKQTFPDKEIFVISTGSMLKKLLAKGVI